MTGGLKQTVSNVLLVPYLRRRHSDNMLLQPNAHVVNECAVPAAEEHEMRVLAQE
jgi:hypothetical protein